MTIPSIFRVLPYGANLTDPVEGPTGGGNVVEIYGDGFRLPDGTGNPTVQVLFAGEPSPDVRVIRSNLVRAVVPPSPLGVLTTETVTLPSTETVERQVLQSSEGPADVVVTNLDAGVAIPGETVTAAGAYAYKRSPIHSAASGLILRYIVSRFIMWWRAHTIDNVLMTQHTSWDAEIADDLNILDVGSMPAIVLTVPAVNQNDFYALRGPVSHDRPDGLDGAVLTRPPRTVDLVFDVAVMTDSTGQLLGLAEVVQSFVHDNPEFVVPRDPSDPAAGTVAYEFDFANDGPLTPQVRPNDSNVRAYTGTVVIRGVDIYSAPGFPGIQNETDIVPLFTTGVLDVLGVLV